MLTGLECEFWGSLDKDDSKHERYVPYSELWLAIRERDALRAESKRRDLEIADLRRDLTAARNDSETDGAIFGFSKT